MLFFLDESGTDLKEAPYEILCAVAVKDSHVWRLIQAVNDLEKQHFGLNLHAVGSEIKGSKLLGTRRFKFARQCGLMPRELRRDLARKFLQDGAMAKASGGVAKPTSEELAAVGQSSIAFVHQLLNCCARMNVKAFAAVVDKGARRPKSSGHLRKDYRILLQRCAGYVKSVSKKERGILVFDEVERKQSRRLLNQFEQYCNETITGYRISDKVIPAPFFVNSESNPLVQLADIIAYCLNWAWRQGPKMVEKTRPEIEPLVKRIRSLEWKGKTPDELIPSRQWTDYGFFHLTDLLDKKDRQDLQKRGEETKFPPQKEEQQIAPKATMHSAEQLSLLEVPSTPIGKRPIKTLEFFDE